MVDAKSVESPPLLVLQAESSAHAVQLAALIFVLVAMGAGGALAERIDALPRQSVSQLIVGVVLTLAAVMVWSALRVRRVGAHVRFFEQAIEVYVQANVRRPPNLVLAWSDVKGFDDGSTDRVVLATNRWFWRTVSVPARSEDDRVALLALLDRKGVKRLG